MKRLSRMIGVAALALLTAAGPAVAAHGSADRPVPIKGTVIGTHWVDPEPVDIFLPWQFFSTGTGQMSHLGEVDYDLAHDSYFDFDLFVSVSDGTTTFTAANGDVLVLGHHMTSVIVGYTAGFEVDGTWTVLDGTGRFVGATGSGVVDGFGDVPGGDALYGLPDGGVLFSFTGEIAYDASNRAG